MTQAQQRQRSKERLTKIQEYTQKLKKADALGMFAQLKESKMMPFDPASGSDINIDSIRDGSRLDDAYELLQYSTELLVADVLDKGTFIKIKYLIDSMDAENHEMARKILHAKAGKNE